MRLLSAVIVGLFALTVSNAHATQAGFHAGLNIANFSGDVTGNSSKVGFKFGGQVEFQAADWFYIEPGLAFTMKGTQATVGDIKSNLNYLDLPILMKAKFDAGGWWPYLLVGPNIGFAIGRSTSTGTDLSTTYKSIDFGLNFGGGAAVPVGEGMNWFLDIRYELGLANILESAVSTAAGGASVKNANISFNTGLNFAI